MRHWFILCRTEGNKPKGVAAANRFVSKIERVTPEFYNENMHLTEPTVLAVDVALGLVVWLVWKRRFVEAAAMLWSEEQFTPEPKSAQRIWRVMQEERYAAFIGGSAMGKSFCPCVWLLLDWISDPWGTRVDLVSTDEQKLKGALFSKIANLHASAAVKLPGVVSAETLSLDTKAGFGFFLQLIQRGPESSGELKGAHISARATPHVAYGKYTRRRVMLDEAEEIPVNVWGQIPNVFASSDGTADSVKVIATANPKNQNSLFGQHCKPKDGWSTLDPEADEWRAEKGALVLRIDARKSENVMQKRDDVYRGIQTWTGYNDLLASCGGDENHPDMWTFAYGMFPPQGPLSTLIPQRWMTAAEGEWIFDQLPINFGGFDTALEGDTPALAVGRAGRAVKWRNFAGMELTLAEPRFAVQLDAVLALPHGDTQGVADELMARCRALGIEAENLAIDITGMPGVGDIVRRQWNRKVLGYRTGDPRADESAPIIRVNYAEKASEVKIAEEDLKTPADTYDRRASELWYALARFFEMDLIRLGKQVSAKTLNQLGTRRGGFSQKRAGKMTIEPKTVHKKRLAGESPDLADSATLFVDAARQRCTGLRPKSSGTVIARQDNPWQSWVDPLTGRWKDSPHAPQQPQYADIRGFDGATRLEDIKPPDENETDGQSWRINLEG